MNIFVVRNVLFAEHRMCKVDSQFQCLLTLEFLTCFTDLCDDCYFAPQQTMANLARRIQANQKRLTNAHRICGTCVGAEPDEPIRCESLDCPWLYARKRGESKAEFLAVVQELLNDFNDGLETGTLYEDIYEDEEMLTVDDDGQHRFTTPEP
jgi:DNA polymerase zeta